MKKIRKMFLFIVMAAFSLATILARSGSVAGGQFQSGKTSASLKAGQIIYMLDKSEEILFKGSFSGKKTKQIYEFALSEPGHVSIRTEKFGAGIAEMDLELFNERTGERIGPCFMSTKAQKKITVEMDLEPGFYTVKASAPALSMGSKAFTLGCSASPSLSGGQESGEKGDGLWFQKAYEGEFSSEYEKDFYRFQTYFDKTDLALDWNSTTPGVEYSLLSIEDDRYVTMKRGATGTKAAPGPERMQDQIQIPEAGEYCLVFYTGENGSGKGGYDFRLDQETDQVVKLDRRIILPGEEVELFTEEEQKKYDSLQVFWESREEAICDKQATGHYFGDRQGKTELWGYGRDEKNTDYRFILPVTVEFEDVRAVDGETPYYYNSVYWAATNNITAGVRDEDGVCRRFNPEGRCTRAQMITFLWRLEGSPEPSGHTSFPDISPDSYYEKAVTWAYENGIAGGYEDGTFRPREACTRADAVTFLYRLSGSSGKSEGIIFTDVVGTEEFCNAVAWSQEHNIVGGYPDGEFKGERTCTRAQMVTFLYRFSRL